MGWGGPHELVRQRSTYEKIDSSGSWYGLCESGWGLWVNVWGAESHPQLSHAPGRIVTGDMSGIDKGLQSMVKHFNLRCHDRLDDESECTGCILIW